MPRFDRSVDASGPLVRGYAAGGFVIDGACYAAALMTPERALAWDAPAIESLSPADVEPVVGMARTPEFLLLGTGGSLVRPPVPFVRALEARGIGVEVMDSRAAARTWGVLRAEERWIAAALMPL